MKSPGKSPLESFLERNRLFLAFFLSGVVLFVYSWIFPPSAETERIFDNKSFKQEEKQEDSFLHDLASESKESIDSFGSIIWLEGEFLRVGVESRFGSIRNVILKEGLDHRMTDLSCYKESLLDVPGILYVGENILNSGGSISPMEFEKIELTSKQEFVSNFILKTGKRSDLAGIQFFREYQVDGYKIRTKVRVKNFSKEVKNLDFKILNGTCIRGREEGSLESTSFDLRTISYTKDGKNRGALPWKFSDLWSPSENQEKVSDVDWIAVDDRFYIRALDITPSVDFQKKAFFYKKGEKVHSGYEIHVDSLKTDVDEVFEGNFYFLPKNRSLLNRIYAESRGTFYLIYRQFSFMKILSDVLYNAIIFVYDYTKNYGFSLILVTVLLKIIVFPFAKRSHFSMKKMQLMEPRISEIRKKYKDNSQLASLKLMQLYQQEKINPASGCLSTLLPAPFFIALYSLFQNMVELEGQKFLWIQDLAFPDVVITSYDVPFLGGGMRILPFLVSISHILQMRLLPKPIAAKGGEVLQKQMQFMNYFLPVLFFFICWKLPSGLVLFWLVQNVLSIFQSMYFLSFSRGS